MNPDDQITPKAGNGPSMSSVQSNQGQGPKVSVVMPVYNAAEYLQAAINSVLAQAFEDWELVLIDDGSTDDSPAICKDAAIDPRVRLESRPNTGIAGALNDGLAIARGHYIARLDADDLATPTWLQTLNDHLDTNPESVLVGGGAMQIDHAGRPLGAMPQAGDHETIKSQMLQGRGSAIIHSCCMFRASILDLAGKYDPESVPSEDLDLFLRMARHGRLENVPERLVRIRRHTNSSTAMCDQEQIHQLKLSILKRACEELGTPFNPASVQAINHPSSKAEAFALWFLLACRSRQWKTAAYYAKETLIAIIKSPLALVSVVRRIVYAVSPSALRRLFASRRQGAGYSTKASSRTAEKT